MFPDLKTFKQLCSKGNLIPVYKEFPADVETPVSAFLKIAHKARQAFLLESVEGGEQVARYSFLGIEPSETISILGGVVCHTVNGTPRIMGHGGDPLAALRTLMNRYQPVPVKGLPPFHGGAVGYLAYDMVRYFERLPGRNPDDLGLPEAMLFFTENLLIFDHVKHVIKIVANVHVTGRPETAYRRAQAGINELEKKLSAPLPKPARRKPAHPLKLTSNVSKKKYLADVAKCKDYIRAGDIIQVQLSQRLAGKVNAEPFEVYRALRAVNPSPYMYYLRFAECELIGSSPEILVRREGQAVSTRPIAGTIHRGDSVEEDKKLERQLLNDPKERAEHIMLVDLGRNDLGRVCKAGTVCVPELMVIERYSHVMHIVSLVKGKLRTGQDQFDTLRAAFPAGTVTGAPKIRAMEIIDELETCRRGSYAGAVGYFSYGGDLDTAITIRTILYSKGTYYLQAAAGIVADSVPEKEYQETLNKMRALVKALELAHAGWPSHAVPSKTRR